MLSVEPAFVVRQMRVVLDDIGADCLKTGMLHTPAIIDAVADTIETAAAGIPLVVDPVMVAKGGARLLDESAHEALVRRLLPLASVLTPNAPEAEALTGIAVIDPDSQRAAGEVLVAAGARAVLVKGGHVPGAGIVDLLVTRNGVDRFEGPRIDTAHTHGTGCTLASAIAAGLAQKLELRDAVARAREYVLAAIRSAPGYGHGHGPLDHGVTVQPFGV